MEIADMLDFLEIGKPSFEQWVSVASGAINKSAKGFEAMKKATDLESLGAHFEYGMHWLNTFDKINNIIVPGNFPGRVKEFTDTVYSLAKTSYQKL